MQLPPHPSESPARRPMPEELVDADILRIIEERVLVPDDISVAVVQLCDGVRSIIDIVAVLAAKFAAPPELIQTDCLALLQDLADKGFLLAITET